MSTGMRALLDVGTGSVLLAEACPVVSIFRGSAMGPPVVNPIFIGTIGLLEPCMENG